MLELYQFGNSVCAQKVRITMAEKGLEWQTREVDLFTSEQYSPKYLKINPKGVVPTLVHDGVPIIESTLICEYLDDTFPQPQLIPSDPYARAQMRLWSKAVDEGLHEGIVEISFSAMFRERMKNMTEEQRQVRFRNVGDPKRRDRFKSTYELGTKSPFVGQAVAAYEKAFERMETALEHGDDWLLGADYSLADINIMPYVARLEYLGLDDIWLKQRPNIQTWWARAKARPACKQGLSDPLSATEIEDMAASGARVKQEIIAVREAYFAQFPKPAQVMSA